MKPHKILGHVQVLKHDEIKNAVEFDRGKFYLMLLSLFLNKESIFMKILDCLTFLNWKNTHFIKV